MSDDVVLQATDVVKTFSSRGKKLGTRIVSRAVNGVSLEVRRGETLGIVGESGCGKSTLARCLVQLLPVTSGTVAFEGTTLTGLSRRRLRPFRRQFQLVFQDPYASLNPRRTVGDIVSEPMRINHLGSSLQIAERVRELFTTVGLDAGAINRYPHEFSGGQRQRIGIARSLSLNPTLVIADEPVSALDVSIQAQVLNLLRDLQRELGLTVVFIAHDLSVVRHMCNRVAVMYLGKIVEIGPGDALYGFPRHPYTGALLSAVPVADPSHHGQERRLLSGDVPSPANPPSACRFHTRCPKAQELCSTREPLLEEMDSGTRAACHFPLTREEVGEIGVRSAG